MARKKGNMGSEQKVLDYRYDDDFLCVRVDLWTSCPLSLMPGVRPPEICSTLFG